MKKDKINIGSGLIVECSYQPPVLKCGWYYWQGYAIFRIPQPIIPFIRIWND